MFQWFRQMSVIARLRGLAIMAVVTMLALSSSLLWTSYKQRLADRQAATSQGIELANASVQWTYARQKFGKLDATQARQHTLAALDRLKRGHPLAGMTDDVHSSMLSQTALTLGAVVLVSGLLWASIEVTARDLRGAPAKPSPPAKNRHFPRGPEAYRHGPVPPVQSAMHRATMQQTEVRQAQLTAHLDQAGQPRPAEAGDNTDPLDPNEATVQEVRRLRMAGAI